MPSKNDLFSHPSFGSVYLWPLCDIRVAPSLGRRISGKKGTGAFAPRVAVLVNGIPMVVLEKYSN